MGDCILCGSFAHLNQDELCQDCETSLMRQAERDYQDDLDNQMCTNNWIITGVFR